VIRSNDIVRELEDWLARRARGSESAEVEIDLVRRAIAEIKALRERLRLRRATRSIATEDLNASNDE
jgi:hypothetical protein